MSEVQKLASNKEIIAYLAEKFPKCFILEGEARPLKIGLFQDLAEALQDDKRVSKTQLRQALRAYTSNWRYLHSLKVGAVRVDLDGNDSGELTQEHIEHAQQQLEASKARVAAKRAEKRAANPVKKPKQVKNNQNKADKQAGTPKPRVNKPKPALVPVDMAKLEKGQQVKIKAAEHIQTAIVLEVAKDSARVQLHNGLTLDIAVERLFV